MIQRIQTLYLVLAILSMALLFAFKVATIETPQGEAMLTVYGASHNQEPLALDIMVVPPYVFVSVIILVLLVSVFLFKNRKQQMLVGRLSYLIILGFLVFLYFAGDALSSAVEASSNISYGAGIYFPVAALAFVFLANRAIKKDEDLVRSLDRLR